MSGKSLSIENHTQKPTHRKTLIKKKIFSLHTPSHKTQNAQNKEISNQCVFVSLKKQQTHKLVRNVLGIAICKSRPLSECGRETKCPQNGEG